MMKLSQLAIYPIKSTSQISLTSAQISPFGLELDRRWMLVDANGFMLTQRVLPRMCLITNIIQNNQLIVNAPNMSQMTMSISNNKNDALKSAIRATVWKDTCNAYDCGDEIAKWFSDFLNTPARLVYFPEGEVRQVDENYANKGDITAFSDGFPYLLIGQSSLDDLNSRLESSVEMARFRPNLVISDAEAFAEDEWKKIRIGEVIFSLVKPCSRCPIPSINPQTAEKTPEVINTLATYRKRDNKIFFGQNLIAKGSGLLTVGMPVEILE